MEHCQTHHLNKAKDVDEIITLSRFNISEDKYWHFFHFYPIFPPIIYNFIRFSDLFQFFPILFHRAFYTRKSS